MFLLVLIGCEDDKTSTDYPVLDFDQDTVDGLRAALETEPYSLAEAPVSQYTGVANSELAFTDALERRAWLYDFALNGEPFAYGSQDAPSPIATMSDVLDVTTAIAICDSHNLPWGPEIVGGGNGGYYDGYLVFHLSSAGTESLQPTGIGSDIYSSAAHTDSASADRTIQVNVATRTNVEVGNEYTEAFTFINVNTNYYKSFQSTSIVTGELSERFDFEPALAEAGSVAYVSSAHYAGSVTGSQNLSEEYDLRPLNDSIYGSVSARLLFEETLADNADATLDTELERESCVIIPFVAE